MKKLLILASLMFVFCNVNAQNNLDLTGKTFQQVDKIPNSTTELYFVSKTQVDYIITNVINGKTYVDRCQGNANIKGTKISINCSCDDKDIYPEPIVDGFIYNSKSKTLTSISNRSTDGVYFVWILKQ
jgi:hypothetical protein